MALAAVWRQARLDAALADWQTFSGQDANSISVDSQYINPNGNALTGDLHIFPTSPCVGAGLTIAGITNDFDNDPRANPPAIGADEPPVAPSPTPTATATLHPRTPTATATLLTADAYRDGDVHTDATHTTARDEHATRHCTTADTPRRRLRRQRQLRLRQRLLRPRRSLRRPQLRYTYSDEPHLRQQRLQRSLLQQRRRLRLRRRLHSRQLRQLRRHGDSYVHADSYGDSDARYSNSYGYGNTDSTHAQRRRR